MYPYTAGATALASALPPWLQMAESKKLLERLKDPPFVRASRKNSRAIIRTGKTLLDCGGPVGVLIASAENLTSSNLWEKKLSTSGKGVEEISKTH